MVSDRTKWTSIDNKTKEYIIERDRHCIICGKTTFLTIAHVFVNRAHGGKGSRKNLVCLCADCHILMDNPIGKIENEKAKIYLEFCKNYLKNTENIVINKNFIDSLIFSKSS